VTRYDIVPERSRVWIDARSNVHPIHSTTEGLEGYIDFDGTTVADAHGPAPFNIGANPSGRLSLRVERLRSGNRFEDRELHKRVDARRYPTIDGVLTSMKPVGTGGRYKVSGDVAFRGVTRPCEDEMSVTPLDDRTICLEGKSTFDIRDFGMEPPRILILRVEPDVVVRVEIVATKADGKKPDGKKPGGKKQGGKRPDRKKEV
jgi:polyisoprenoid-binding protein YceI